MSRTFRSDASRLSHAPLYETVRDLGTFDEVWKKVSFQTLKRILKLALNRHTRPAYSLFRDEDVIENEDDDDDGAT